MILLWFLGKMKSIYVSWESFKKRIDSIKGCICCINFILDSRIIGNKEWCYIVDSELLKWDVK